MQACLQKAQRRQNAAAVKTCYGIYVGIAKLPNADAKLHRLSCLVTNQARKNETRRNIPPY